MPSNTEIKQMLRPLLARRPDLASKGRKLFFSPFTHYLRGVLFKVSVVSFPQLLRFVNQLCIGWPTFDLDARGLESYQYANWDDWDRNNLEKMSQILCEEIEQRVLPILEPIVDYAAHMKAIPYQYVHSPRQLPTNSMLHIFNFVCASCTQGDFDAAEELLSTAMSLRKSIFPPIPFADALRYDERPEARWEYLLHVLRTDRSQILPLLHEWEAFTVSACGLTKYWKPSPFPCEL